MQGKVLGHFFMNEYIPYNIRVANPEGSYGQVISSQSVGDISSNYIEYSAEEDIIYFELSLFIDIFDTLYVSNFNPEQFTYTVPALEPVVAKLSAYYLNIPIGENIRFSVSTPKTQEYSLNGCSWMLLKLSEAGNTLIDACSYQSQPNVSFDQLLQGGHYLFIVYSPSHSTTCTAASLPSWHSGSNRRRSVCACL